MAYNLPEIHQATLPGGMKLLGVEYDRVPWLSLTFMAKRGAETDPLDKPGVADWAVAPQRPEPCPASASVTAAPHGAIFSVSDPGR